MDVAYIFNLYCRKFGIWFLSLIPIFLAFSLIYLSFFPLIPESLNEESIKLFIVLLYFILIITAIPFSLNGFFMEKAFNSEIRRISSSGLLIQGVEGFNEVEGKIKLLYRGSYSVIVTVVISFFVFVSGVNLTDLGDFARIFIFIASIGLLAISSGASILLKLPDKSALQPGGLMKFYSPSSLPLRLDNILTDSIFTQLDPITRIRMDEWSKSILDNMNPSYGPNLNTLTRLEQAKEKIFLLTYLKEFSPDLLTEQIFLDELKEIINKSYLNDFLEGKETGISLKTLQIILRDVKNEIPHIFTLVQRIFVLVNDNIQYLQSLNEFITISHPTVHIGNIDPFRVLVFILNLQKSQRKVDIRTQTSQTSLDPDDASQGLLLDSSSLNLPNVELKLKLSSSTEPIDVLRLVSEILQVGDALNLQFRPNRFGTHVLNLSIEDPQEGILAGRSIVINVYRDLNYYVKSIGAKALGYAGAALSFVGIGLGSLAGLLNF